MAGRWDAVPANKWPNGLVAVHMVNLAIGKVLTWAYGENHPELEPPEFHTHAAVVWDPVARTWESVPNAETNVFCAGHAGLEDGRVFVAGGHISNHVGLDHANIFDTDTQGWSRVADLQYARWYPTCTTLPDGRQLTTAGSQHLDGQDPPQQVPATIPEVYLPDKDVWSQLDDADRLLPLYPYLFVMPNGNLFFAGYFTDSRELDLIALQ